MSALSLAAYQDAFAQALLAHEPSPEAPHVIARLRAQPGFAVYRNTVLKGCVDALQANYPAVARLVGDEWFRAAAAVYARGALPVQPTLLLYGDGFADFLADFAPAADLPYLAGVARLDRAWSEAHVAADAGRLAPGNLAVLDGAAMAAWSLQPHPAARWRWFDALPIYTLWHRNRGDGHSDDGALDWRGEGALLTRADLDVRHRPLARGGAAFLDACARGEGIAQAVTHALDADPATDFVALIWQLLDAGAFCGLRPL